MIIIDQLWKTIGLSLDTQHFKLHMLWAAPLYSPAWWQWSLTLWYILSCLFYMLLNEDIEEIEKSDGICSLIFVVDGFSELFLHLHIFSIIHPRSAKIINGVLSDFWYWLNSNILVSSKDIIKLQKS